MKDSSGDLENVVPPSGDLTTERVFLYSITIALIISVGIAYLRRINSILLRFIESNAFEKSMNIIVIGRFFDFTPSTMRRILKICPIVDLFFLKPF